MGYDAIFWYTYNKNLFYNKLLKNVSASRVAELFCYAKFLTVNFVACNMQQNQIRLILLLAPGNKNLCFTDNLEKNLCVSIWKHIFCNIFYPVNDLEHKKRFELNNLSHFKRSSYL